MRIGVFPMIAGRRGGGVETYEVNLIRGLASSAPASRIHVFCLGEQAAAAIGTDYPNIDCQVLWPRQRWISFPLTLPRMIARSDVDLVHATFVPPLRCARPLVVTIHDVCLHTHPELYPSTVRWRYSRLVFQRLRYCDQVICPSRASREVLLRHFPVDGDRVTVVTHGVDPRFRPLDEAARESVLRRYGIESPYLLFSGNLRVGNKNLVRTLTAFHEFRRRHGGSTRLVLTGKRSWFANRLDSALDRLHLRDSVIETGWIPPEDLPAIYGGATMLLFASLCEGFGLPALEAMACGTPVITSTTTCMPEVTGDAALLVDPTSVEAIAQAMSRLQEDPTLRDQLRERGLEWARQFTWDRTAKETLQVYSRALEMGKSRGVG